MASRSLLLAPGLRFTISSPGTYDSCAPNPDPDASENTIATTICVQVRLTTRFIVNMSVPRESLDRPRGNRVRLERSLRPVLGDASSLVGETCETCPIPKRGGPSLTSLRPLRSALYV